jgi:hypothetical protein
MELFLILSCLVTLLSISRVTAMEKWPRHSRYYISLDRIIPTPFATNLGSQET